MMVNLILGIVIMILLAYIFYIKKEILNISNQLNDYNNFETEKKLDINLINKEVEALAESINKHIEISNNLRLNEVKSKNELKEMIENISHDLRTPLTSIVGYIQMIKLKGSEDKKDIEYLNKVEKKAKDLGIMLEDFFMLSIIENKDYNINLQGVKINEILCDELVGFYEQLEKKGIEPNIELEEVGKVLGDVGGIKRVIENLMINVIKHSNGELSIKLEREEDRAKLMIINSLKDGKRLETDKLFDKFYKGNDSSRQGKNTGLGLSIVKSLMEHMDGQVLASQVEDKLYITCKWKSIE